MIRIPQHNPDRSLNDIIVFIPFIESICVPKDWSMSVEWCLGDNAREVELSQVKAWNGSHLEFKLIYQGIFQTIDGTFTVNTNHGQIRLSAVDSSFWDVESPNEEIEELFVERYGIYVSPLYD